MQWGTEANLPTVRAYGGAWADGHKVLFPIQFPNKCLSFNATHRFDRGIVNHTIDSTITVGNINNIFASVYPYDTDGMIVSTDSFSWIAIGY